MTLTEASLLADLRASVERSSPFMFGDPRFYEDVLWLVVWTRGSVSGAYSAAAHAWIDVIEERFFTGTPSLPPGP